MKFDSNQEKEISTLFSKLPDNMGHCGDSLKSRLHELFSCKLLEADKRKQLSYHLMEILPQLPDPVQASTLLSILFQRIDSKKEFTFIFTEHVLHQLLALFSFSGNFSNFILKYPNTINSIFPIEKESLKDVSDRYNKILDQPENDPKKWLRLFKAREFIKIALGDYLKFDNFQESTHKISMVADICLQKALDFADINNSDIAIMAMGKLGGFELNYSSDIDLLFVGNNRLSSDEIYQLQKKLVNFLHLITQSTEDGFVFRVDNRLRPEGSTGSLLRTLEHYLEYYQKRGAQWEFQALIKARYSGGSKAVADEFIKSTRPLVYNTTISSEELLQSVRDMKRKIETCLVSKNKTNKNVKLGRGGIRDIEFIVQFLQLHHGRINKNLRVADTLTAIQRLSAHRIIKTEEKNVLQREYIFQRKLEHCLQMTDNLPVRQLPRDFKILDILARKLGKKNSKTKSAALQLETQYHNSTLKIRNIFNNFFNTTIEFLEKKKIVRETCPEIKSDILNNHFTRLESDYFLKFNVNEIIQHIHMISHLSPNQLCDVSVEKVKDITKVTIAAFDYIGQFAKICGLFSAYGHNIENGESFTYSAPAKKSALEKNTFYRRPGKRYYSLKSLPEKNHFDERKIVCVANLKRNSSPRKEDVSWNDFQRELEELLTLLRDQKHDEASERITLRVISSLNKNPEKNEILRALPPIFYTFDNNSDQQYTILEIVSPDKVLFLFDFFNALAIKGYYIGKVEFQTIQGTLRDRLFLTTKNGKKIISEKKKRNLRQTMTMIKQFSQFLPYAPNPLLALKQFNDLLECSLEVKQKGMIPIIEQEDIMEALARILGTSSFLWEDFIRMQHENLLHLLDDASQLDKPHDPIELGNVLKKQLSQCKNHKSFVKVLNEFKDKEMFRIDLRHLTRRIKHFRDFCKELSDLADIVTNEAYFIALKYVEEKMNCKEPGLSGIYALGKWGGREIGYASDIEILFIWDTSEDEKNTHLTFYEQTAQIMTQCIKTKQDGIFELDFRLRPGGKNSYLTTSCNRFTNYFSQDGEADFYERQALIRLRPVAGKKNLHRKIENHRLSYVFGSLPINIDRISHLRTRQETELVQAQNINAKFSAGGLVDAEYYIQILQMKYGSKHKDIRSTNTLIAAKALKRHKIISPEDYNRLDEGYRFLRALINGLRIVRGNARDLVIPPPDSQEFQFLIRRLESFEHPPGIDDAWQYIKLQMQIVHQLFKSLS